MTHIDIHKHKHDIHKGLNRLIAQEIIIIIIVVVVLNISLVKYIVIITINVQIECTKGENPLLVLSPLEKCAMTNTLRQRAVSVARKQISWTLLCHKDGWSS